MEEHANVLEFPKHFDGKRFYNPDAPQAPRFLEAIRWKLTSRPEPSPRFISDVEPSVPPFRAHGNGLRVTLVNHSTALVQQRGSNILTDPIWSDRASPFSWVGPRRRRKPGVSLENLPPIDAVLISHNHYDHLDLATPRQLAALGHSRFIVPARAAKPLRAEKIDPVHELEWGESLRLPNFSVHCVPALHFAQIRERSGPPRLALLPIGAYQPRWFMSPVHMGPEEAAQAHETLGCQNQRGDPPWNFSARGRRP